MNLFNLSIRRGGIACALMLAACQLETEPVACEDSSGCTRVFLGVDAGVDSGLPVPDAGVDSGLPDASVGTRADGDACDRDAVCASAHCNHGVCCSGGNCCLVAEDCPASAGVGLACDNAVTCQGTRGDVTCDGFRCATQNGVADDRACTTVMEANNCGAFPSIFCSGAADQQAPACPTTCRSDSDCDRGSHCDGTCLPNVADGARCSADAECANGHCMNQVCCASGDCCATATDCPASYTVAPRCDTPSQCQGSRTDAMCVGNMCVAMPVDDDSGCGLVVRAMICGANLDVFCSGQTVQATPMCGSTCDNDSDCVASAHCDGRRCVSDMPNGASCSVNTACQSGYCQNGACCGSGTCCTTAADCGASFEVSECDVPDQCQGYRQAAVCNNFQCGTSSTHVPDDSACGSNVRATCGDYADMMCNGSANQSTCRTSCTANADCDGTMVCTANVCVAPPPTGG